MYATVSPTETTCGTTPLNWLEFASMFTTHSVSVVEVSTFVPLGSQGLASMWFRT